MKTEDNCEWDEISKTVSEAIQRKSLTDEQINKMITEIKVELNNKNIDN